MARDLFAEGALSAAFVPTFTRYLSTKSREQTRELSNITGTLMIVIVGTLCALGMLFSGSLVGIFAPAFHAVPGKFEAAMAVQSHAGEDIVLLLPIQEVGGRDRKLRHSRKAGLRRHMP